MSGHRQKGKAMKRKRSWHRRGSGPDRAWRAATRALDDALHPPELAPPSGRTRFTMNTYVKAAEIAHRAHRDQVDALGRDYFMFHVMGVVAHMHEDPTRPSKALTVALLHDVVEDTTWALDELSQAGMPAEVVEAVDAITRRPGETYAAYIERVCTNPLARAVKVADNAQNLADNDALAAVDPARAASLRRRYETARDRLVEDR